MATILAVPPKHVYREDFDIRKLDPPGVELREQIDPEELNELGQSIGDLGPLTPLLITTRGRKYELIAGGRRIRSAKSKGLFKLPAYIYDELPEDVTLLMSLIENIQRVDLEPIWEARAYRVMQERDKKDMETIAREVRKPESRIRNRLKLLGLDVEVQRMVQRRELPTSTALVIAEVENKSAQRALAVEVKDSELSHDVVKRMVDDAEREAERKRRIDQAKKRREREERGRKRTKVSHREYSHGPSRFHATPPSPPASNLVQPAPSVSVPTEVRKASEGNGTKQVAAPVYAPLPAAPQKKTRPDTLSVKDQDNLLKEVALKCEKFVEWVDRIKLKQFDEKHLRNLHLMAYRLEQGMANFTRKVRAEID
jgi:ParB family transcriptional regulator, chromosome partitioning protein